MAEEDTTTTDTRYAVYDHTLLRYVTGVHGTKADAERELVKEKGHKYETRPV